MPFVIVSGVLILSQVIVRIWVKPTATAADQGQAFVFWIALLVGGLIATAILFLVGVAVPWGYLLLAVLVVFGMLLLVGDRMTTVERVLGKRSMAVGAAMGWLPIAMMIAFSGALAWLVGDL